MMRLILIPCLLIAFVLTPVLSMGIDKKAEQNGKPKAAAAQKYPKIVLYSTAWCPHCQEAKEYFDTKQIPFENRDVEEDAQALDALQNKYQSPGVPVVVIGDDEKVLKGFSPEEFESAAKEVLKKKKK